MKECEQISMLYVDVIDDQADAETAKRYNDHLSHCQHCRDDYWWYSSAVQALSSMENMPPPPDFMAQLHRRLDAIDSPSFWSQFKNFFDFAPRLPLPVGVAALLFVVAVGFASYMDAPMIPGVNLASTGMIDATAGFKPKGIKAYPVDMHPGAGFKASANSLSPSCPPQTLPVTTPASNSQAGPYFPTVADRLGADNVTVESPIMEKAVASLMGALPELNGKMVDELPRTGIRERMFKVMIPPNSYGDLLQTLVTHGALQVGAGEGVTPPKLAKKDGKNVLLHIRFVNPR